MTFDDGTVWDRTQLREQFFAQASTPGADNIAGFNTNDIMSGGAGADTLSGASGADTLDGGDGADVLIGGAENDVFRLGDQAHSTVAAKDIVMDFSSGGDKIDLSSLDANAGLSGDQAFIWIGTAAFTNVAGQLRYDATPTGSRTIYGDNDGDAAADFSVQLTGGSALQTSDFLL